MIYALSIGAMTFAFATLAGTPLLRFLDHLQVRKEISPYAPGSHQAKEGTPTMGGILIICAVLVAVGVTELAKHHSIGIPLATMSALAALGLIDDLGSLRGRKQAGLNKRVKFLAFLAIGLGAAFYLYWRMDMSSALVPYAGSFDIHWIYIPIAASVVVLTAGGTAVTDGLDGLAAGAAAIAYLAYGVIALQQEQNPLATFCFATTAASLGFLWYNSHPAQVFMGDLGALALGGGLAAAALLSGQWLVLPVIGIVFVLEGASTYGQVAYFRMTGGKRILRMAPLHHHFEALGWSEPQIVQRFWLLGALGALLGVILALEV